MNGRQSKGARHYKRWAGEKRTVRSGASGRLFTYGRGSGFKVQGSGSGVRIGEVDMEDTRHSGNTALARDRDAALVAAAMSAMEKVHGRRAGLPAGARARAWIRGALRSEPGGRRPDDRGAPAGWPDPGRRAVVERRSRSPRAGPPVAPPRRHARAGGRVRADIGGTRDVERAQPDGVSGQHAAGFHRRDDRAAAQRERPLQPAPHAVFRADTPAHDTRIETAVRAIRRSAASPRRTSMDCTRTTSSTRRAVDGPSAITGSQR